MTRQLLDFTDSVRRDFGFRELIGRHRLHESHLFSDEELIALLDAYPRQRLHAFTMGSDPNRGDEWKYVDASGLSGKDIFQAVVHGRLWLNLLRVDLADRRIGELLAALRAELTPLCPRLKLLDFSFGTLLISSPDAIVYYHFDTSHQALWHIRGRKRIWIYPACDSRFVSQEVMEANFAGVYKYLDEDIPYSPEYDQHAVTFDLEPGDVASWPQNGPHRVENRGSLNVSLTTGFETEAAYRRTLVYSANRLFRRHLGLPMRSTRETGLGSAVKCFAYRACRRAGLVPKSADKPSHVATLVVDPEAPLGYRPVTETRQGMAR